MLLFAFCLFALCLFAFAAIATATAINDHYRCALYLMQNSIIQMLFVLFFF